MTIAPGRWPCTCLHRNGGAVDPACQNCKGSGEFKRCECAIWTPEFGEHSVDEFCPKCLGKGYAPVPKKPVTMRREPSRCECFLMTGFVQDDCPLCGGRVKAHGPPPSQICKAGPLFKVG